MGLLNAAGWEKNNSSGEHQIWTSTEGLKFVVSTDKTGNVPPYQVQEFLANLDRERVTALMRSFKIEFAKQNPNPEIQKAAATAFMKTMEKTFGEGRVPNPVRNKENARLIDIPNTKTKNGIRQQPDIER